MGLAAGAAPAGEFGAFHAQPVDPRSGAIEPVVLHYGYGVLVNRAGERFTDEAARPVDAGYERVARAVLEQPEGLAWAVFDAGLDDAPHWRVTVRSDREPLEAPTVEALAEAAGLDPAALAATLAAYNAACPEDGSAFRPDGLDGLATQGLRPPKSNWARPLVRPPFRAWPVICANCFTFGGLRIDIHGRVDRPRRRPDSGPLRRGRNRRASFTATIRAPPRSCAALCSAAAPAAMRRGRSSGPALHPARLRRDAGPPRDVS